MRRRTLLSGLNARLMTQLIGKVDLVDLTPGFLENSQMRLPICSRMVLPEAFLATDVILNLIINVSDGLQVWPNVIKAHIKAELPFMATENILMACVKAGGDRQELHEAIRMHSMEAGKRVKVEGAANDLLERIAADSLFQAVHDHMDALLDPSLFIGRCPQQVEEFIIEEIAPILKKYAKLLEVENVDNINV